MKNFVISILLLKQKKIVFNQYRHCQHLTVFIIIIIIIVLTPHSSHLLVVIEVVVRCHLNWEQEVEFTITHYTIRFEGVKIGVKNQEELALNVKCDKKTYKSHLCIVGVPYSFESRGRKQGTKEVLSLIFINIYIRFELFSVWTYFITFINSHHHHKVYYWDTKQNAFCFQFKELKILSIATIPSKNRF